ncbi:hypothetical protein FD754_010616 [Muntiacus muntjak]|uniref:Immunoglobulin V-set domain-containing protein n=1 Tax=Muntiacus muntjak TaxID=9888 RepID=A0A5N3WXA8_MUNMU|nr:hypothetical protein FD754_010616 [Muntiacus muntjak]
MSSDIATSLPPGLSLLLENQCTEECSLSLSGLSTVTGTMGASLSVECHYEEEYRAFHKYWCRQPCFLLWQRAVQTSGSEVQVKSGRVSVTDHPEDLAFTRCGVATILEEEALLGFLPDPFFQVQVIVSPWLLPSPCVHGEQGVCGGGGGHSRRISSHSPLASAVRTGASQQPRSSSRGPDAVSLSVWHPLCLLSLPLLLLPSLLDSEPEGSEWWAGGSPQTPGPDKVEGGWMTTSRIF